MAVEFHFNPATDQYTLTGAAVTPLTCRNRGGIDLSANPNYPTAKAGDFWSCTVAGTIGGADGKPMAVGDAIIAIYSSVGGTEFLVGGDWLKVIDALSIEPDASGSSAFGDLNTEEDKAIALDILVPSGATFGSDYEVHIVQDRLFGDGNGTKTNPIGAPNKIAVDEIMNSHSGKVFHWGEGEFVGSGWQPNSVDKQEWVVSGSQHVGAGRGKTILKNGGSEYIQARFFGMAYDQIANNFGVHDLTIDCNASGLMQSGIIDQCSAIGIAGGSNIYLNNVEVINFGTLAGECFPVNYIAGAANNFHYGQMFQNIRFENLFIHTPASGNVDGISLAIIVGYTSYGAQTSGSLIVGRTYEILYAGGGVFTNVGAANNNVRTRFVASGTTPTSWGSSQLSPISGIQLLNAAVRNSQFGDCSEKGFSYVHGCSAPLVEICDFEPMSDGAVYLEPAGSIIEYSQVVRNNKFKLADASKGVHCRLGFTGYQRNVEFSSNDFIVEDTSNVYGIQVAAVSDGTTRLEDLSVNRNKFFVKNESLYPLTSDLLASVFANTTRLTMIGNEFRIGKNEIWIQGTTCSEIRLSDNYRKGGPLVIPYDYANAVNLPQSQEIAASTYTGPTADPHVAGKVWSNAGVLTVSSG